MEEKPEAENVKYYEIRSSDHSTEKFKYSLLDIQFENISESIKDENLRTAVLQPEKLKEKLDDERELLLYDLALLENTGELKSQ